ncbi:MAG TPA: FlgD immunoglobulin-like domain containing protein, partial [Rubricoccaceae bacterium]
FWNGTAGTLEGGQIPAFSGFLVKANAPAPTLVVPEMARPPEQAAGVVPVLALHADAHFGTASVSGSVFVQFDGRAAAGLDALDAYALALPAPAALTVSAAAPDGTALALSAVPPLTEAAPVATFPLTLGLGAGGAGVGGTVSLTWPDLSRLPSDWVLQLRDAETGAVVDLRRTPSYTVVLAAGGGRGSALALRPAVASGRRLDLVVGLAGAVASEAPAPAGGLAVDAVRPNPAASSAAVAYTLDAPADVSVEVFDVTGRRVQTLASGPRSAGHHETEVVASDLAPGIYAVRVVARGAAGLHTVTRRITVAR